MSIILDALKKAQGDGTESNQAENSSPVVNTIPSLTSTKKSPLILIGALAIAIAVLGGSGGFYAYKRFVSHRTSTVPAPQTPVPLAKTVSPEDLRAEALALYEKGDLQGSRQKWQKLIEAAPSDASAYNNLGLVLKKMGDKVKAEEAYRKALEIDSQHPEALNNLGTLLMEGDKSSKEAMVLFSKAIQVNAQYADPHFHIAMIQEREGNFEEAASHYAQFLQLSPTLEGRLRGQIEMRITLLKSRAGVLQ